MRKTPPPPLPIFFQFIPFHSIHTITPSHPPNHKSTTAAGTIHEGFPVAYGKRVNWNAIAVAAFSACVNLIALLFPTHHLFTMITMSRSAIQHTQQTNAP